jgi:Mg-chelatase subunit ChlD
MNDPQAHNQLSSGDAKPIPSRAHSSHVQARPTPSTIKRGVDVVFVIDTTGSMSTKIEGLLATCAQFVEELIALQLNQRIALVAFGDLTEPGDKIVATDFTDKLEVIKLRLQRIPHFHGGANKGESSLEALEKMLGLPFRTDVVKVAILITDEPALQKNRKPQEIIAQLRAHEVLTFVVSPDERYFKAMAKQTGGQWYKVSAKTDFTTALNMFRRVAQDMTHIVSSVYQLGDGRVQTYLQLKPPT